MTERKWVPLREKRKQSAATAEPGRWGAAEDVWVTFDKLVASTEAAEFYKIDSVSVWIPISQIKEHNGQKILIPLWLAKDKDLV